MDTATLPSIDEADRAMADDSYYLGSGVFRSAYHIPGSRWVYKKEHYGDEVNRREYEIYLKFSPSLRDDVRFPEMHLLPNGVLAAEYVDGDMGNGKCWNMWGGAVGCARDCDENCWAKRIEFLARCIKDLHNENIRIASNGTIYIIDLGGGERRA